MKVSLNWMKWYGGKGLDASIDELVETIGAQLGAVEAVENLGAKYQGVVVAKVVSCVDHPNADRLHVCTIDDGGNTQGVKRDEHGYVQVVCGAPNVREGLLVAWLPPGATVPESVDNDPFVLEARELRGVVSNGMLASPKELALGDSHEGLLELDGDVKPGDDFAKAYGLDDYIIDIENKMFTHRPDCFGQLGVAREIAGISGQKFTSPDWYLQGSEAVKTALGGLSSQNGLGLEVRNEVPSLVPRFMAVALSNVEIKPSPMWLQTYLLRAGVRPISNVVDITNYMMLLTGQPMHVYDYDKVKAIDGGDKATIVVRHPRDKERITLLNGKQIDPRQEAIMIATETQLIGVGGVMGGVDTEVDNNTKNIILEVANFDMYSIRRTSMAHGLFTDAVTRFNKGQSPLQNDKLLAKAVQELQELAGATVASEVIDLNELAGREWVHPPVPVTTAFVNARLGLQLTAAQMKTLLENVEFTVVIDGDKLTVTAPFWRTDVETREDVVEEVGRLYGFDKLPLVLPEKSIAPVHKNDLLELKATIRQSLATAGANEVLTYSFVHGDLLDKVGQDKAKAFKLSNALSPDLQYYRLSLLPSLLEKVHPNVKAGYDEFALFELGKTHEQAVLDDEGLPAEFDNLALVYTAHKTAKAGAAYYEARKFLTGVAAELGFALEFAPLPNHIAQADLPFALERSAMVRLRGSNVGFGIVGEFTPAVRKNLKLPEKTAGFELGIGAFLNAKDQLTTYAPLPRFPKVTQDITLKVPATLAYQELFDFVWGELAKAQPTETLPVLGPAAIYQPEDDAEHKNITLRLTIASYQKTLTDGEVNSLLDKVAQAANSALGAERV